MDETSSLDQPVSKEHRKVNRLAIASFAIACFTLIYFPFHLFQMGTFSFRMDIPSLLASNIWVYSLFALPAISLAAGILGAVAFLKIEKSEPRQKGIGLAVAGCAMGVAQSLGMILAISFLPIS